MRRVEPAAGIIPFAAPVDQAMATEPYASARRVFWVAGNGAVPPRGPLDELLADYRRYLREERRLCEHTVLDVYGPTARLFLAGREGPGGKGRAGWA
jgi:hypothetical protein